MNATTPSSDLPSPAREREAALLSRCVAVARREAPGMAEDAPVLALAATLLQQRHPDAARALAAAAARLPGPRMPLTELLQRGLIVDLPRFKARLLQRLAP